MVSRQITLFNSSVFRIRTFSGDELYHVMSADISTSGRFLISLVFQSRKFSTLMLLFKLATRLRFRFSIDLDELLEINFGSSTDLKQCQPKVFCKEKQDECTLSPVQVI